MDISVVIPLYNKEKYIYRTIASVLNQTVPPAEIVVIDDGSSDNSVNEVQRFNDRRIRLVRQQNSGEGATRNKGVAASKNDMVAFLDADDEWKPDFLLHIQRLVNNFPDCGAYATAYEIVDSGGSMSYPLLQGIPPAPWIGIIPNLFRMMQYSSPLSSSSVAMPKNVFYDLKGFPEGIKQGADRMMWVRLGVKYPIAFSPSCQAVYHREALNRACNTFEREPATANLIDRMLRNQEVPLALLEDVKDYCAALKIQKARLMVKEGHAKMARELLGTIQKNRKYSSEILWWYFWSIMPYSFIKLLKKHD
jgi:glycosyltransferase involved in cell wall biosynthesis